MKGQELKGRIAGIKETVKITKAMEMISASKLHKAQQTFDNAKRYLESVSNATNLLTATALSHPYFVNREGNSSCFIVVAGDKGLCGDYNHLILGKALASIEQANTKSIVPIGYIARDFFKKKGYDMVRTYLHLGQDPMPYESRQLANEMIKRFESKEFDKVYIAYTDIKNLLSHSVVIEQLLPIKANLGEKAEILTGEESVNTMLSHYIIAKIYYALCSSSLAINYKRMVAMQQSTTNGEEIISELVLQYNHKRQESITTELVDASASLQGKRL